MMCGKLVYAVCIGFVMSLTGSAAVAGISYAEPLGGWTYIYTGEKAAPAPTAALDGTWDHKEAAGGSDAWDGSAPGQVGSAGTGSAPGGAGVFTEAGTTFLRIQDCGDPRDAGGGWADPSNRKLTLCRDLGQDAGVNGGTILNDGVTLSFRARIPTTPPLDNYYPDGGSANVAWTTRGYNIHDDGYGGFGVKQGTGGNGVVCFSLALDGDEGDIPANGLVMNKLNGTAASANVDSYDSGGTVNILTGFDPTQWHEFWIQIVADTPGGGTHKVTIWIDGNTGAPDGIFHVTAGTKDEYDFNGYLVMSLGRTAIGGAQDVDFFAYKPGLISPAASDPEKARAVNPIPDTTVGVLEAIPLSWLPGKSAQFHDVYFGIDKADVSDADKSDTTGIYRGRKSAASYSPPEGVELGKTYYWRIDEIEANGTPHKGEVWSFTVTPYILVDDFEDYNDLTNLIYLTWIDGYGSPGQGIPGNGTGSTVGNTDPPYAEQTIVRPGSAQSMPLGYNNSGTAKLSEAIAKINDLKSGRDWTTHGVKALSLWFRGYPAYMGSFIEAPAGTYAVTAGGTDIGGTSDQCHFAYKEVSGASTVVAKVLSVSNTHTDAKAGVMIRDSLDADSAGAMVYITPGGAIALGYRDTAGASASVVGQVTGIAAPQWLKIERALGGIIRGYYSADGTTWTQIGTSIATVTMNLPVYVGLAVTSHNTSQKCAAQFSNVSFPDTSVGPQWSDQDVGIISNKAEPMYVAIPSGNGKTGIVYHDDPNATLINAWTEWNIDLKKFSDQGVSLANVDKMFIGFGNKANPKSGGTGTMYFDDIRLYPPRCILDKLTGLEADFTKDCTVDVADLQIVAQEWLKADYTVATAAPKDANLALYYKFENNAVDSSGKGINGTATGSPTYASGALGQAISLNGSNYINCGKPALLNFGLGNWSIAAWVKTSQTDKGTVFANGGDETGGIRYAVCVGEITGGAVTVTTDDNVTKVQATGVTTVNNNQWHHVIALRDGLALRVYVDGVLDGSNALPASYDLSGASQHNAYVGAITDHTDATGNTLEKFYSGLIDDLHIYNYALSAPEAGYLATKGSSGLYFPLQSVANLYDQEPQNQKKVNFKDLAVLADTWLVQQLWP
jgi:hypothetical protein